MLSKLFNLAQTLHSLAKFKNKQVAKIWGLYLKKQRFGDTMLFPEGLENTPFNTSYIIDFEIKHNQLTLHY